MQLDRQLESLARQAVEAGDVPGVAIVIVGRDGNLHATAAGTRCSGQVSAAMTPDSIGWWAGLSQPWTAVLALQLVEQGRVSLDEPAQRWLPALGEVRVLAGFANGRPQLRRPARPITLRHLLSHTAGFGIEIWSADLLRYQELTGAPGLLSCRPEALQMPLLVDPGERWCYGIGVDWAGRLVEAVEQAPLEAVMHAQLFEPLGVADTGFRLRPAMQARLARLHQRAGEGWVALDLEVGQSPSAHAMGGGGLYGSALGYARFLQMLLADGRIGRRSVLQSETIGLLDRNAIGDLRVQPLHSVLPWLSHDIDWYPGLDKTWTLAMMRNEQRTATGRPAGGLMWGGLPNASAWVDRASGVAGVVLLQVLPLGDARAQALYCAVERLVYEGRC